MINIINIRLILKIPIKQRSLKIKVRGKATNTIALNLDTHDLNPSLPFFHKKTQPYRLGSLI